MTANQFASSKSAKDKIINFEAATDLISDSEVKGRMDLGHALVLRLKHPQHGDIIVLNSTVGKCAVLGA